MGKKTLPAVFPALCLMSLGLWSDQAGAKFTTGAIAVKTVEPFYYYCLPQKGPMAKIGEVSAC